MDDDAETISGAVENMGQWTIKVIAKTAQNAAISAARDEGMTVGQWLEKRIREWTSSDSPRGKPVGNPVDPLALLKAATAVAAAGTQVKGLGTWTEDLIREARGLPAKIRTPPPRRLTNGQSVEP
jgi:hypothetical protein